MHHSNNNKNNITVYGKYGESEGRRSRSWNWTTAASRLILGWQRSDLRERTDPEQWLSRVKMFHMISKWFQLCLQLIWFIHTPTGGGSPGWKFKQSSVLWNKRSRWMFWTRRQLCISWRQNYCKINPHKKKSFFDCIRVQKILLTCKLTTYTHTKPHIWCVMTFRLLVGTLALAEV